MSEQDNLHQKIMNLQPEIYPKWTAARLCGYQLGHRDARHAAAELAVGVVAAQGELIAALKVDLGEFKRKYNEAMSIMSEWQNVDSAAAVAENQQMRADLAAERAEVEREKQRADDNFNDIVEMEKERDAAELLVAQLKAQLGALHGKIMNLPESFTGSGMPENSREGYRLGHRHARHAAAELCAATAQPGPSDGDSGEVGKS